MSLRSRAVAVNFYVFDVDDTLWCSNGPIQYMQLINLKRMGHILGICGNFARVTLAPMVDWPNLFSAIGPMTMCKRDFLWQLKQYVLADRYVMVGNVPPDDSAAKEAGWEFVKESDFKEGLQ